MIDAQTLEHARNDAVTSARRLVDVLEERLGLEHRRFIETLGELHRLPVLTLEDLREAQPLFDTLPFAECAPRGCVLVQSARGERLLVSDDPFSGENAAWAEERLASPFRFALAHRAELAAYLASHEQTLRALDGLQAEARAVEGDGAGIEDLSLRAIAAETSEIVKLVRSTLRDALLIGASDVHLETSARGLDIKFRIDGILSRAKSIEDPAQAEQAIARVKVLAELDVTERRVPQDGRFKALSKGSAGELSGRPIDFRVSIMPSVHGEDAVVRVLDKQSLYAAGERGLSLDSLGLDGPSIRMLRRLSREPYGMLLVTGPTGSGKTTTLYAAITEINDGRDKIVTIEDPVEYELPGVLQIPVNEKKGLTFAKGLRSILRHDPDKIMVGEIRDPETANIAVQSALTGHLVFTTVHANNVFDVIGRFMHMNVDLYSFVSALNAIVAQRLVRLLCPACAVEERPAPELLADSAIEPEEADTYRFRVARGCAECRGVGYRGRKAIAELLVLNDEIRELITARAPVRKIKDAARRNGTRLLREAALAAVGAGQTSLEEINRVTFVD